MYQAGPTKIAMNQVVTTQHKLRNLIHTLLLVGGMALLLAVCGELLFGRGVWPWVFVGVAFIIFTLPDFSSRWVLRLYQARPLHPQEAPQLAMLIRELSGRAGLKQVPGLYWIPSQTVNAFAVGTGKQAAIAITDGLLRILTPRELAGVLAHEISHISHNDVHLMGLADVVSRLTHMLSMTGMMLAILSLPLILFGAAFISFWALVLLIAAPTLSALLQMGLSRIREFDADLEAVQLTGDPDGLASALGKIEQQQQSLWQRLLFPGYRTSEPSLLRTHPDTRERIRRLMELAGRRTSGFPLEQLYGRPVVLPTAYQVARMPEHKFIRGVWH